MMSIKTLAVRNRAGGPGRHRRRGLMARLHVARTVRVRAGRVLGAGAVVGVLTVVCVASALALTRSGAGGIPSFQKPDNPFLHSSAGSTGGGTAGNPQPADGAVLPSSEVPVPAAPTSPPPARLASVPSSPASLLPPSPARATTIPGPSASPSSSPSPAPSASRSGPASPAPSASPSGSPRPSRSASPTPSATSPSGY